MDTTNIYSGVYCEYLPMEVQSYVKFIFIYFYMGMWCVQAYVCVHICMSVGAGVFAWHVETQDWQGKASVIALCLIHWGRALQVYPEFPDTG